MSTILPRHAGRPRYDQTSRPRAIIFNQEKEDKMLPEAACAFIRHAFNIFYHDFANVEKGHIFVGILQSPHVLSEGSDAICGENQTTTHSSDIHRPYSGGLGGEQKRIRENNPALDVRLMTALQVLQVLQ